ncbi:DLEC1 [Cervus elaphus hippelaphus]|uniref:DLEC1 n=1 Tax=Cervus elaphus hippelaphus TaxID=46360 RepID=A0A212C9A7_CEREH|nr:DLEC1 [Cervus elaphus hippelaphus]
MVVVGCPISSQRTTYYTTDQVQREPVIRFGTRVSGGDPVTRILRLNNSSPCDIRLDWETYTPEDREDRLLELLVFYGPPFPLRDHAGNDLLYPETPESSGSSWSPSPSESESSHGDTPSAEGSSSAGAPQIISVILQGHEGAPSDHLFTVSPKQVVVPAGGSSTIHVSFTPVVLGPDVLHKVECVGYALGFLSLDDEVERELPGRRRRLQDFAVGPMRLDLHGYVRPAQLSVEWDYDGSMVFRQQASDLIPEQPCAGVLSELVTTHHLKLTNATEIPHYFRLLVSKPFSVSQVGASRPRAPGWKQEGEEETAARGRQLVLHPQENMLVVPLRAVVAVPELQLSTSWVDFGTCFVNQGRAREVYLMNLSGCRSYWAVLTAGAPHCPQDRHRPALGLRACTRPVTRGEDSCTPRAPPLLTAAGHRAGPAGRAGSQAERGPGWACRVCGREGRSPGGGRLLPEVTARTQSAQVNVSFSLSLELLSYQKLPADQMLPGVDIQQSPSGEKQMVFTQNLLLAYSNQTSQPYQILKGEV